MACCRRQCVGPQCRELIMSGKVDMKMNCIPDLPDQRTSTECATFFSTTHSCPNEASLTYVPCSEGYAHDDQLKSVGIQFTTLVSRTDVARDTETKIEHIVSKSTREDLFPNPQIRPPKDKNLKKSQTINL
ncbi:hypothetical protein Hdeb2414_s0010g00330761 [Helianthus debilis subsp. tardiflorus]